MDALSDVLRLVGLSGGVFLDAEFTEPWSVAGRLAPALCRPFMAQPEHVICFHYVLEGGGRLETEHGVSCDVSAGQVVVLPRNDTHVFHSARAKAPIDIGELLQLPKELGVARIQHGGGGAPTKMVCGFLGGNAQLHPMLTNLPPVMTIALSSLPSGDWMARTFAFAAQTMAEGDPGAATVLAKMSELMFVEAVRRHLSLQPPEETGWLAGLRDPAVGRALALLHSQLDREWTSESLAHAVNLSRSMFAERFTRLIGVPPMRYLLNWRMQVAKQKLRETRQSIAQIAFGVGYESEAAFTRAFSPRTRPPSRRLAPASCGRRSLCGNLCQRGWDGRLASPDSETSPLWRLRDAARGGVGGFSVFADLYAFWEPMFARGRHPDPRRAPGGLLCRLGSGLAAPALVEFALAGSAGCARTLRRRRALPSVSRSASAQQSCGSLLEGLGWALLSRSDSPYAISLGDFRGQSCSTSRRKRVS